MEAVLFLSLIVVLSTLSLRSGYDSRGIEERFLSREQHPFYRGAWNHPAQPTRRADGH